MLTPKASLAIVATLLALGGCGELIPQRSEGEKLYRQRCASCHGLDARGTTPGYLADASADLTDEDYRHGRGDDAMAFVIRDGVMSRMPANPDLTPEQVREIVKHLNALIEKARQYG